MKQTIWQVQMCFDFLIIQIWMTASHRAHRSCLCLSAICICWANTGPIKTSAVSGSCPVALLLTCASGLQLRLPSRQFCLRHASFEQPHYHSASATIPLADCQQITDKIMEVDLSARQAPEYTIGTRESFVHVRSMR